MKSQLSKRTQKEKEAGIDNFLMSGMESACDQQRLSLDSDATHQARPSITVAKKMQQQKQQLALTSRESIHGAISVAEGNNDPNHLTVNAISS